MRGNTVPMALGEPLNPSTTAMRIYRRPRGLEVVHHLEPELGPLGLLDPQVQHLLVAFRGDRHGEEDDLVPYQALVADLHP